jgi:hypothetical protein
MPKTLVAIPMDLGSGRISSVLIAKDVVDYFNIPAPTEADASLIERNKKAHSRRVYTGMADTVGKAVAVEASKWSSAPRIAKGGTGVPVRIPTELTTTLGNTRFATIRFPSNAVTGAISAFLHSKCVLHKPSFFIMNGNRHLVLPKGSVLDVNPGEGI